MMSESVLQRIIDRAGLTSAPADLHPLAHRDRRGYVHLPLEATVELARAFAAAEPTTVIGYLDDQEEEMRLRGNQPGERWWHSYLREQSRGFAIARQWAGLEQEAEMLRKEIARLRSPVSGAAYDLEHAGAQSKARRPLRALEGRWASKAATNRRDHGGGTVLAAPTTASFHGGSNRSNRAIYSAFRLELTCRILRILRRFS
jgi:hypothetical protein